MTTFLKTLSERFGKMGMKLGLDSIAKLDAACDSPHRKFHTIHVAGTNGKGSVTNKIALCLEKSGLKTGLYTSPHISTYRERIKINGEMIEEKEAEKHFLKLFEIAKRLEIEPTFFEYMTLLAFLHFAEKRCDVAVIEVGMGGRFDATNIITPILSIITTIDYDHTKYLGKTLEAIALEKAGIIKPGVPLLVGPCARQFPLFAELAGKNYTHVEESFDDYELENRAIAAIALTLLPFENISREGLLYTPPCRFEIHEEKIPIVLDVAHNPSGFNALVKKLKRQFPGKKFHLLLALGADKEIDEILKIVKAEFDFIHITEAHSPRAAQMEDLAHKLDHCKMEKEVGRAFEEAKTLAMQKSCVLVVAGTFYIMSEIRRALGIQESRDSALVTPY